MRILVGTPFVPDPTGSHGGSVYLGTYILELAKRAEVTLVCLASPSDPPLNPELASSLAAFEAVPHRQLRDLATMARLTHRARMLAKWGAGQLPLLVAKYHSTEFDRRLRSVRDRFRPDVAILEQAVMAQYLPALEGTPTVFADHERGESIPARIGPGRAGATRDGRLWSSYVQRYYPMATLVQALNSDDAEHLSQKLGILVETRPLTVPLPAHIVDPSQAPNRALFLGNYLHSPNAVAATRIARDVWPIVRSLQPDAELWLAGLHAGPEIHALAGSGVRVIGAVDNLETAFAASRTLVAPVFSGSGVRVKLLSAMAHGLPVVSNALGLRGVDTPPPAAQRKDTDADLAAAVVQHLRDPAGARAAGALARQWVEENVSSERLALAQLSRLQELAT